MKILIYIQQVINYTAALVDGRYSEQCKYISEERTENQGTIEVKTRPLHQDEIFSILLSKELRSNVYKIMKQAEEHQRSCKNIQKLNIFFISQWENINFSNGLKDSRSHQYFRIVMIDQFNGAYVDEFPILDCNIKDSYVLLQKRITETDQYLHMKNKFKSLHTSNNIPVVFAPQASGFFIHEVVGHLLEADTFDLYGKSLFENVIISNRLTVKDDPEEYKCIAKMGKYDDMGNQIHPVTLIDEGRITGLLSHENGSMRRENLKKNAMPRMRCTYICPSDNLGLKQIISQYETCILITHAFSGSCNAADGTYCIFGHGQLYKHGKVIGVLGNLSVSASIQQHLSNIHYVGNDYKLYSSDCSKIGNVVRVGMGGPSISFKHASVKGKFYS